jgi:hypothetical protein
VKLKKNQSNKKIKKKFNETNKNQIEKSQYYYQWIIKSLGFHNVCYMISSTAFIVFVNC